MLDKAVFRKEKRAEIRSLPEDYILASNSSIFHRLLDLPELLKAVRVFAYLSVGREIDTRALINELLRMNKTVFLPVVLGDGIMEFAKYEVLAQLVDGNLNIPEPDAAAERAVPREGDLILVPGLCFDTEKYRMGQGGGYYDRFLANCPAVSVGLARERLMSVRVPREQYDLPVNVLITESRTLR